MKIKLDENLSRHIRGPLERLGHDVDTVLDEGLEGRDDTAVGIAAVLAGRLLFTLDVEFADVRKHPPGSHPGIVLFRLKSQGAGAVAEEVMRFVAQTDLKNVDGCIVVVDEQRVRVRTQPGPGDP